MVLIVAVDRLGVVVVSLLLRVGGVDWVDI